LEQKLIKCEKVIVLIRIDLGVVLVSFSSLNHLLHSELIYGTDKDAHRWLYTSASNMKFLNFRRSGFLSSSS